MHASKTDIDLPNELKVDKIQVCVYRKRMNN
jgi:hypothetical protein